MPTNRPRLTITLTDDVYETLGKLSDMQGRSISSLILEHLELVNPVHKKIITAIDRARRIPQESKAALLADLNAAQEQAESVFLPLLGLLDGMAAGKPPSSNTGVTSLSSPANTLNHTKNSH